uniref:Tfp pilus assembly protein tip-associated adhesin PilY1-like protein n=1 Tax=uncultured Nitrospirae bacterium MY3-11A TaxID=798579 RepID=D9MP58_9BACT|nr:Tfp pilus assembly protein tip-associated adhesin PilY1-like protein [uncultured Nitrospirae bacterium MY3-11A]
MLKTKIHIFPLSYNFKKNEGHSTEACSRTASALKLALIFLSIILGTAIFAPVCYAAKTLSVTIAGTGTGSVSAVDTTDSGYNFSCSATCSNSVGNNDVLTLTATPTGGATFAGWSGVCSGTGTCSISMNNSGQSVTATFTATTSTTTTSTSTTTTTAASTSTTTTTVSATCPTPSPTPTPTPTPTPASTAMQNYCASPPFIQQTVPPNLLLMFDNSYSMYDPAYYSTTSYTSNSSSGIYPGFDNSYSNTTTYPGYFDNTTMYIGNGGTNYSGDGNCSTFSAYTGSKTCSYINTSYLCISLNSGQTAVTEFVARGNFLNWLTMSKMDIQKMILTGGKYDSTYNVLIGEGAGWNGMRYIKSVDTGGSNKVTFGIRGPNNGSLSALGGSNGGTTRIDIFKGTYDYANCLGAVYEWLYGNFGQAKQKTADCIPDTNYGDSKTLPTFNHAMQTCWGCTYPVTTSCIGNGDVTRITGSSSCGGYYSSIASSPPTYSTVDPIAGICATTGSPTTGSKMYVGGCWNGTSWIANGYSNSDDCVEQGFVNYCNDMAGFPVTDPSGDSLLTAGVNSSGSLPGILLDFGLTSQLGDPLGVYQVRVEQSTTPTGLINEFSGILKFGVMTFNTAGSASECDNITLVPTTTVPCPSSGTNLDAGQIVSYIPTSDDSATLSAAATSLVSTINAIRASSWTPWAEAYYNAIGYFASRTDMRLNTTDFDESQPPVNYSCRQNNILIISDGMSTTDQNINVKNLVRPTSTTSLDGDDDSVTDGTSCYLYEGSTYLDDLAWLAKNKNIFTFDKSAVSSSAAPTSASQYIRTYTIFNGEDNGKTNECSPTKLMSDTATNGGGTYKTTSNASQLETALRTTFTSIATNEASGTAATVLSQRTQAGANIMQVLFYPNKYFSDGTQLSWVGFINNLWFYNTKLVQQIREDTVNDYKLNITNDNVLNFTVVNNSPIIQLYSDITGTGTLTALTPSTITFDNLSTIWEAGGNSRAPSSLTSVSTSFSGSFYDLYHDNASVRTIYTNGDTGLIQFNTTNASHFSSYMGTTFPSTATVDDIIEYTRGVDKSGLRNRTTANLGSSTTSVWKLGDIIYSTPLLHEYKPASINGNADYYVSYVGANDGMLHAFKVGKLSSTGLGAGEIQQLTGSSLGRELWGFIPRNSLPYLRYLADTLYTASAGCHIYFNDLKPYIYSYTPSGATDDKVVLIGGMRLGGACGCSTSGTCPAATDIYNPPTDTCTTANRTDATSPTSACVGLSSYYALDITNPTSPSLLWEFSHPELGFSYSGPAVINRGGNLMVMFLSGPQTYTGYSYQNLKSFVLALNSDFTIDTAAIGSSGGIFKYDTGIARAYGGRLFTNGVDINADSDTDYVIAGYTSAQSTTWDNVTGGIMSVYTGGTAPTTMCSGSACPTNWTNCWKYDTSYFSLTAPVTSQVNVNKCFSQYYAFAGSGKYFKSLDTYSVVDSSNNQLSGDFLYASPFFCDQHGCCDNTTLTHQSSSTVPNACNVLSSAGGKRPDWTFPLNSAQTVSSIPYYSERNISDPTFASNMIFFTTTQPTSDLCSFGGRSRGLVFNCATAANPGSLMDNCTSYTIPSTSLQGNLLMQLSTSSINKISVSTGFHDVTSSDTNQSSLQSNSMGGVTDWMPGITPEGSSPFLPPAASAFGKILNWMER